jgi:hypothetical protein
MNPMIIMPVLSVLGQAVEVRQGVKTGVFIAPFVLALPLALLAAVLAVRGRGRHTPPAAPRRRGRVGAALGLMLLSGFVAHLRYERRWSSAMVSRPVGQVTEVADVARALPAEPIESVAGPPPVERWRSPADLEFEADLYHSVAEASESLAVLTVRQLDANRSLAGVRQVVVHQGRDASGSPDLRIGPEVLARVSSRLQKVNREWSVTSGLPVSGSAEAFSPDALHLLLQVTNVGTRGRAQWNPTIDEEQGTVHVRVLGDSNGLERFATYVTKPWVENFPVFAATLPVRSGTGAECPWVAGYSSSTATSSSEARVEAIRDVAASLLPRARARLIQSGQGAVDDHRVQLALEQAMSSGIGLADRFEQSFRRPYGGTVCRQAVLVDVSSVLSAAVRDWSRSTARARQTWMQTGIAAAILVSMVCVLGLALNVVTRGYYRGRIALASSLLLALGGVGIVLLCVA